MFPPYNSTLRGPRRRPQGGRARPRRRSSSRLSEGLTDEVMQELNARVDLDKKTPGGRSPASTCPSPASSSRPSRRRARPVAAGARLPSGMPGSLEPLRFEDGALLVLDQRALPARGALAALREPGRRWPSASARWPCAARRRSASPPPTGWRSADDRRARPRAAARDPPDGGQPRPGRSSEVLRGGRSARAARASCTASRTRPTGAWPSSAPRCFAPGDRALTHCNAGALATARLRHRRRRAARRLGAGPAGAGVGRRDAPAAPGRAPDHLRARARGHPLPVITDSSAGTLMARGLVDRVVVGADRIAANGDVANKVGTYPLAVLAAAPRCAVLRGRAAVDVDPATPTATAIPIEERDAGEVAPGVPALNLAFDVTPAELVDRDRHRGRRARGALRGGDRGCRWALRSSPTAQAMLRLGLVTGTAGNVSARDGRADPDHAERARLRRT